MRALIVDTDVVSMVFKQDSRATLYEPVLTGSLLGISFMTLAELELWPRQSHWGPRRLAGFRQFLENYTVLPYNNDLCVLWAQIVPGC